MRWLLEIMYFPLITGGGRIEGQVRMVSIEALSAALRSFAAPGMTPKALRAAVRETFPAASKKSIVRAAFHALIEVQSKDGQAMETLHNFALFERMSVDDEPIVLARRRKKRQSRPADRVDAAA